ncbi:MAG: Asp-tRNA(Asn)/Glu-tRNA(Gln) amidotransferase subunit GatC [Chlamydiia bacterium]|nr:Asp-tRNA(Asn)/Glu-tRNA(Gln) amidotransferase subunit GatC [Chlamydiia bacterium]
MPHFDRDTLRSLQQLCRIDCSAEEQDDILQSLSRILKYVEALNTVETCTAQPCDYVLNGMGKRELREDIVGEIMPREQFLSNAPDQIAGMIRVPPVLKNL